MVEMKKDQVSVVVPVYLTVFYTIIYIQSHH